MKKLHRISIICVLTGVSIMTGLFINNSYNHTEAAIAVIDSKNISETHLSYLEGVKTVQNTLTQIQNQIKELTSLPTSTINNFKNQLSNEMNVVANAIKSAQGDFLNPSANPDASWGKVFTSVDDWGKSNIDYLSTEQGLIHNLDIVNKDAFRVLKANNTNMETDIKKLNELMEINQSIEGNKQGIQVNNMLQAHANELKAREVAIKQAEATATIAYYQRQNQIDAQAADRAQKLVNEFDGIKNKGNPLR